MTGETLGPSPTLLEVTPDKLEGLELDLGPYGHGAFILRDTVSAPNLELIQTEIFDPTKVQFRDVHDEYVNKRGIVITQNHFAYALKLLQGDPAFVDKVPLMRQLAGEVEDFVKSLDYAFPSLGNWVADEMSLHRYDDPDVGLSFHRDNLRFPGLVVVVSLEGESKFSILGDDGIIYEYTVRPGDMALTRAPGLYESDQDIRGQHGVYDLITLFRTSLIVRANDRPDERLDGFEYDNWDMLSPDNPYSFFVPKS